MASSNGIGRKLIKIFRLPIICTHKIFGFKIKLSSSYPIFSTVFENRRNVIIGKHSNFDRNSTLRCYKDGNKKGFIIIGNNVSMGENLRILSSSKVVIEDNCSIASNVFITSENHGLNPQTKSYNDNPLSSKDILIKDGAWLGEKVIILPGVTVGKKAIVGAGSVVTKDIPDYSIAVGNPAKVIKKYDFEKNEFVKI